MLEFVEATPNTAEARRCHRRLRGLGGQIGERIAGLCTSNTRVHGLVHVSDDKRLYFLCDTASARESGRIVGAIDPAAVPAMRPGVPILAPDTVFRRNLLGGTGVLVQQWSRSIA